LNFPAEVLTGRETAIYALRALYLKHDFTPFVLSGFEEYGLYAENRSFLASDKIISFTDAAGKLMALRPDVTLSIIKNLRCPEGGTVKLCYNENVYRPAAFGRDVRERMQVGLEVLGSVGVAETAETLILANESLRLLGTTYKLCVSHMGLIAALLAECHFDVQRGEDALRFIAERNTHDLAQLCSAQGTDPSRGERLIRLTSLYAHALSGIPELLDICSGTGAEAAAQEIREILSVAEASGAATELYLDFSATNDLSYYNGLIFQGFLDGVPSHVLSGGRYDKLLPKFGKSGGAVGFAVYIDMIAERGEAEL
jgi:ATP phosphoribosyltransferase regulatory subunit